MGRRQQGEAQADCAQPGQLGQRPPGSRFAAQSAQNVHSKEQMRASAASAGKSLSQHSQLGLSWSIALPFLVAAASIVWQCLRYKGECA
jgi:hypothetical protein